MKSRLNQSGNAMQKASARYEDWTGIMLLASKTKKITLAVILAFCFQNQVSAATSFTRPNEPGPWPSIQVNTYTGNLFYQRSDLFIPTRGEIPLDIYFSYNSLKHQHDKGYGNGWSFSLGMYYKPVDNDIVIFREDGQEDIFTWDGVNYLPPTGVYDELTEYAAGQFVLKTKFGIKYYFDDNTHMHLTSIVDRNNNTITLSYTAGRPTTITDPAGRMLNLAWVGDHLTQITDPNTSPSRVIAFQYDGSWNQSMVIRPLGNIWQYNYANGGNMTSIIDPGSNLVTVTYDINDAVSAVTLASINYSKFFTYNNCNNTTSVDQIVSSVNRQKVYTFDLSGRVTGIQYPGGGSVSYTWDSQDNLITYINEMGSSTIRTYDSKGNMLTNKNCLNATATYTYENVFNQLISHLDRRGFLTTYTYDGNGNLASITDCFNNSRTFTYNAYGNVISSKDENNQVTTYTWDIYGNQTGLTDPLSYSETRTFDPVGNMITSTDKRGYTSTYNYDLLDRNTLITDAMGYTIGSVYDANSNLISKTNQNNKTTTYAYDAANRLISTTDANGGIFTRAYDEEGNVTIETNARGFSTIKTYNSRDWLTSVTDCLNNSETYTYNAAGFMLSATDKGGNTTSFNHNCLGQVTLQTDPNGYTDSYTYDAEGNITSHTDKNANLTTRNYDGLGRLITINYPLSYSESTGYDAVGNPTSFTDKNGNTTTRVFDALGRVLSVTDPTGITQSKTYDGEGNVASSTDMNGNTTTYSYNPLGFLILKTDPAPLLYTESFTWDGVGNLLTSTDRRGNTILWQYDNLDRLTMRSTPMGYSEQTGYDANGNVISFSNKNGFTTTYAYDCLDQPTVTTDPLSFTETNSYNANGQRTGFTDKKGNITTWNYSCCRLLSETDPLNFTEYYGYDNNGNRTTVTNRNGGISTSFYDQLDRVFKTSTPSGKLTLYARDGVGNITGKTDPNLNTISYNYNARNELISTVYPDATSFTYSYNNNGDLLQTVNTGGIGETITFTYDVNGNVTSKVTNYGTFTKTISYTLDQNGNLLTITSETGTITYEYDNDNRLRQVTDQNGGVTTYQHDGMGNQTRVDYPNGVSTFTTYDANGNVISVVTQTTPPPPPPADRQLIISAVPGMESEREVLFDTDLAVTGILSPVSGPDLGEEPVTIAITNFGTLPVNEFIADYMIEGEGFSEYLIMTINPGETIIFTFDQYADLSEPGDYLLETSVLAMEDEFPGNNSMFALITHEIPVITYQQFLYDYDPNGNKTVESLMDGTTTFLAYSDRNELTSEYTAPSGMLNEYTYYPGGQRETMTADMMTDLYVYNPDGALMAAGDALYTADNNGNRTSMTNNLGDITLYDYGFNNELLSVTMPTGETQYAYSALGTMLMKAEEGIVSYMLTYGNNILAEYDQTGISTCYYNPGLSITQGLLTGYYCYDGFASSTLQLDPSMSILATAEYDEFGTITGSSGIWLNGRNTFEDKIYYQSINLFCYDADGFLNFYDPNTGIDLDNGSEPDADPAPQVSEPAGGGQNIHIIQRRRKDKQEDCEKIKPFDVTVDTAGARIDPKKRTKKGDWKAAGEAADKLPQKAKDACSRQGNAKCIDGYCLNCADTCLAIPSKPSIVDNPPEINRANEKKYKDWAKKETPEPGKNDEWIIIPSHKIACKCKCITK